MKQKCSFILKASTALVLALLMLFGTVTTSLAAVVDNAATGRDAEIAQTGYTSIAGRLYFDNSKTSWSNVYLYVGHSGYAKSYTMTNTGYHNIWYLDISDTFTDRTKLYFANHNDSPNGQNYGIDTQYGWNTNNTTRTALTTANNSDANSLFTPSSNSAGTLTRSYPRVVAGTIASNGWDDCTDIMTYSSSQWTKTYTNVAAGDYYLAVVGFYNNWSPAYRWAAKGTISGTGASWAEASDNDKNIKLTLAYASDVTVTLTSSNKVNISVSAKAHSVTRTAPTNGTLQLSKTSASSGFGTDDLTVAEGANYWVKATASPGYEINTLTVGGSTISAAAGQTTYTYKGTMGTSNVATSVTFKAATTPSIDTFTIGGAASKTLNIGETATLASTTSNTSNSVTYSTTSDAISITGTTVKALKPVTSATITATLVDGSTYTKTVTVKVNTPTVSLTTTTAQSLNVNGTHTNTATGSTIGSAATGTITYSVGSSTYISVNSSGKVSGLKPTSTAQTMTATYTVTCGGQTTTATKSCNYTVKTPVLTNSASTSMNVDATQTLSASVTNTTGTPTYTWTVTNDTGTASLSNGTTLKALTPGKVKATVTAKFNDSYSLTKDATITIATPSITQGDVTIAKGDRKTLSTATTNPSSGLTVTFALSGSPNGVSCTSAGVVTVAQTSTASTATVVATAKNSGGTTVATKNITVTIATPSLTVKDGSTSVINGTVYTTKDTNKTLTVGTNFSDSLTAKSSDITVATVSLSADNKLTITPKAKGTCKVYVSTDPNVSTTGVDIAATAAAMPEGIFKKVIEYAATGAVATQTAQFTVNVAEADTDVVIYLTDFTYNNADGWGKAYVHAYGDNGTYANRAAMTKVGTNENGRSVYAYKFTAAQWADVKHIVFLHNSNTDWDNGGYERTIDVFNGTHGSQTGFWLDTALNGSYRGTGTFNPGITRPQVTIDDHSMNLDSTYTMPATKLTSASVGKYKWKSATTSVATVTADTNTTASTTVTANGVGTSTITVQAFATAPTNWTLTYSDTTLPFFGSTDTATITVTSEPKTITNNGAYYKTGSAAYASGTTGGTFTVSQTGSLAYNTNITLTATAASGYAVEGIYWSTDGTTWTKVATTDTKTNGYVTSSTNTTFKVTDNYRLKAQFVQVLKLSAFDSYEMKNSQVTFVTAPPKSITIKHTDAHGTATTYTYSYDGTKAKGNPDSPDVTNVNGTLAIASGSYGQGNYIQYYAGDEITLTYSAMASSEILKGVFYNNSANFYVNKPTTDQFVAHSHPTTPAIYMNSAYYTSTQLGSRDFSGVTADNDAHSIKFTGTQDYKNIDVEIGTKRKVYFSDYTNAVITSKNTDDYYYDGEALSVTGDQLTVAAAMSTVQTNKIDNSASSTNKPGFYRANADGSKGTALTSTEISNLGLSISTGTSTSTSSANGTALVISGNMPAYDLYIDLNMQNSYTLKLGTLVVSSLGESGIERLKQKATTISIAGNTTLSASTTAKVTTSTTSVNTGSSATLTVSGISSGYMFVGWYWGDDTAPDYDKGFISDKQTLSYTPKKGGTIWAVGTKELFINGSKYITGKSTDWYSENNTWKNQQMKFDPDRGTQGSYYWEITDTMFASAGNDFKYTSSNSSDTGGSNTEGKYFAGDDSCFYWCNNDDSKHGKAFFQFIDTATGYTNREVWKSVYSFLETADGTTHGKILKRDAGEAGSTENQRLNGQGFIDFAESRYSGYSSPLRIYLDAATKALDVVATAIYSNLYVSNGYSVGSTLKTDAVTVQPVVDGVVKTSGQTGYFTIKTEGSGWDPDHEGHVAHYIPQKKGATIRITKEARGNDKIVAFLIYDIDNKTVRAEKNITKGTTANSKTPYYIDLTLANERQNLYIVPIVEEAGSKVTITFDATQLNRKQWGDIVTAYSWYKTTNAAGLGEYPGQPMIPSDDMSTWTATFAATKGGNELAGITFTNYVDGIHSWLGCSGVMGTVSDHKTGEATGGIINVYNHVDSGTVGEYSRTNYKAQTYDYHEPIALYDRYKGEDSVNITFQMKDGNSSLISWRHTEFDDNNILNLPSGWGTLNWEYLTNAKGDQYIDMNGNPLGANNKPTATFYVASKGQVVYNGSKMDYVFHGGHDYEMKGYTATYSDPTGGADRGSYTRTALASGQWSSDITYGGVSGLDMKYAVQWYVYDAQGNYITTVLSAGIADLASGSTDTYIATQLENMGYAVDGKSVAICYDKPRYMYGDWDNVTNSASNINSGPNFDAYRFEGQWIAAAQSDTVKVNVEVAMMTDSGEVLAHSNTAGYGNASASLRSGITFGKPQYATVATDGSWAQTAATDAKLNGIALNASAQNFIGWYYYDANTGEFTKANYTSNENFYPNYTNKDVTYYAVYRASAVYNYIYRGRESTDDMSTWRVYSASGEDLTPEEMEAGTNQNKVQYDNHTTDVLAKLPVGIGIFKKNIDFSAANAGSWTKNNDTQYILKLSGFSVTIPEYTLTYTYKDATGDLVTKTKTAAYNATAVNLTSINGGTPVTVAYGTDEHKFLGWYEYDGNKIGDLLSTQANYGMRLTRDQSIIAVYEGDGKALPTDGWTAHIDENVLNKELTTSTTGVFYNDTIVRVRNNSDVKATLPGDAKIGVLVVTQNGTTTKEPDAYNNTQLTTLANGIGSGQTKSTNSGLVITNMQANTQTSFNRTDIAVRADYKSTVGAKYCVYAYIYANGQYHFSAPSAVKTYE